MLKAFGTICVVIAGGWAAVGLWALQRAERKRLARDAKPMTRIETTIGDTKVTIDAESQEQAVEAVALIATQLHLREETAQEFERVMMIPREDLN